MYIASEIASARVAIFEPGDDDELIPGSARAALFRTWPSEIRVHLLRRVQPPLIDAGAHELAGHRTGVLAVLE
jgi:hypothetical protein